MNGSKLFNKKVKPVEQHVECLVSGPMALVLRISRIFGMAPIRFRRQSSNSWYISVSPALCGYSYLLLTFLHVTLIMATAMDMYSPVESSVRVRNPEHMVLWLGESTISMIVASVGGYCSPLRMKRLIDFINNIHKIKEDITGSYVGPDETIIFQATAIWLISIANGIAGYIDVWSYFVSAEYFNTDKLIAGLYSSFHIEFTLVVMCELQFAFSVLQIKSTLELFNDRLNKLVESRNYNRISESYIKIFTTEMTSNFKVKPRNHVNNKIISTQLDNKYSVHKQFDNRTAEELINQLSSSYNALCVLIQQLDKNSGLELLLILLCNFVHIVITPYHMVLEITKSPVNTSGLFIQMFWFALHFAELIFIVEPCHYTYIEMSRSRELIGQLLCTLQSPAEPLAHEVTVLYRLLSFKSPQFEPLGMCTLNRSIITAIAGGATTYLVIILQFQYRH